jgi:hypothetical protein
LSENRLVNERGQSLVLVAAAMVVLVGFVALAVDLGNAYYARRTAQNGADGAALAGVSVMATGINRNNPKLDDDVKDAMDKFAEDNGIAYVAYINAIGDETNGNVEGWYVDMNGDRLPDVPMIGEDDKDNVPEGAYGVEAITHITATAFFGGIFGFDGYPVQARAVSLLKQACTADCLVPITTDISLLETAETGQCFNIWRESQTTVPSPGLYGWVSWTWQQSMCDPLYGDGRPCPEVTQQTNACDEGTLADNLDPEYCASGFVKVGDWMSGTSGVISSDDVTDLLDYYIGIRDENGDLRDVSMPVTVTVPMYSGTNLDAVWNCKNVATCKLMSNLEDPCSGGLHYRVAGFARMQILGYQLSQTTNPVPDLAEFDPSTCETWGVVPHDGNRISARFIEWVDDVNTSDACYDPSGTLLSSPKLTE